jgi:glycosyltransferase involved in cell wall biosynthesis
MQLKTNRDLQVLFVCSGNHNNVPPFIIEQKQELEKKGIRVDLFQIKGRGMLGYLRNYSALVKKMKSTTYNLVHAHFGLSGLFANLQRKVPVVTTFHGCDLNNPRHRSFSAYAARLSQEVIVVSDKMAPYLKQPVTKKVIPCGINMGLFRPMDKVEARQELTRRKRFDFNQQVKYILFSSTFDRDVKNPKLAFDAVGLLGPGHELVELKDFTREEVVLMMNAADAVLLTSRTEGSPQFIKEAMACNRPIVTTNVGDVEEIINGASGCFITKSEAEDISESLKKAFTYPHTNGRETIGDRYNNEKLVNRIIQLYSNL